MLVQKTDPSVIEQQNILAANCAPNQQTQASNQMDPEKCKLINAVRIKAKHLIREQQTEALLINLINAQLRPYLLELNLKLFTNPTVDTR